MSETGIWFERKFSFPVPVELFPGVMTRLTNTPARLEDILRDQGREVLRVKRTEKWSAQEHAGHLLDLEPLWLARVEDYLSANEQLTAADLTNRKTHEANHNQRPVNDIVAEFRAARQTLVTRVSELDDSVFSRAIPHPRLGTPMRLVDHLYFVAEHDDHHLGAISNLLGSGKTGL